MIATGISSAAGLGQLEKKDKNSTPDIFVRLFLCLQTGLKIKNIFCEPDIFCPVLFLGYKSFFDHAC